MKVRIRREGLPGDRRTIAKITRSSGFFSMREVDIALEVFDDALMERDSGYQCVIAETDRGVCGYALWGLDEQTVDSYELYWIVVDNKKRGRGVGSLLLGEVEEIIQSKGGGQLFIETAGRELYQPTRAFYEHHGYVVVACIDEYFGPGDSLVTYGKRLAPYLSAQAV